MWNNWELEEPWWCNPVAFFSDVILFAVYTDTNNPDRKSLLCYAWQDRQMKWFRNDFAFSRAGKECIVGADIKMGRKETALRISTGQETDQCEEVPETTLQESPMVYAQGGDHFDTVQKFIELKASKKAIGLIEYLHSEKTIFISFYVEEPELANYLLVVDEQGSIRLFEKIGERLQGIGTDTFFLFNRSLIFVKNKRELITYPLV